MCNGVYFPISLSSDFFRLFTLAKVPYPSGQKNPATYGLFTQKPSPGARVVSSTKPLLAAKAAP